MYHTASFSEGLPSLVNGRERYGEKVLEGGRGLTELNKNHPFEARVGRLVTNFNGHSNCYCGHFRIGSET